VRLPRRRKRRPAGPRWAEAVKIDGLPNLHRVTPSLYRGAQPLDSGFEQLRKLGVKKVINLRAFHSDRKAAEAAGLKCEEISFKTWHPEDRT